ncbi:MAG: AAA family ATPase [Planctomycetota bacterium]
MKTLEYSFLKTAGRILNSGQARTLILTGNIHDLFYLSPAGTGKGIYVPLVNFLAEQWDVGKRIIMVYELNGPIRFLKEEDREKVQDAWLKWRVGLDSNELAVKSMLAPIRTQAGFENSKKSFEARMQSAVGNPTVAFELLRQICLCSRSEIRGKPVLKENLILLVEAADMIIPEGEISRLSEADRHRVSICRDWFSDPDFMNSQDSVLLISESRSLINHRIARLPQVIEVPVPSPDDHERDHFVYWFRQELGEGKELKLWSDQEELVRFTAGLSILALMQLLKGACHANQVLTLEEVLCKVEEFIQSQVGEDVVEFKKPTHGLDDLVGFEKLKTFLREELIPRFRSSGPEALSGAAVCGPIGGGKTFIFEAVANELDMVVLVLKNIRSQWFGQTDVIFERLRRVLDALAKVLIFVDEADTQFGGVGAETHATERRLTGKIQAMMSDSQLRGRVIWLLMTARIHRLSPDIRRPGRVGDLIIPVLDPEGSDQEAFLRWALKPVLEGKLDKEKLDALRDAMPGHSAAGFASLRSEFKAKAAIKKAKLTFEEVISIVEDLLPPAIGDTRRYQTLQALVNCTRRSLLPDPAAGESDRQAWHMEILKMEARGVG